MEVRDLFGLVGTTIAGKFRVESVIGEGGFGVVYAGVHVMLGERVAIKCLKPTGFTPEESARAAQAFLREGRILFGLGHPAIVRLYDVGIIEDRQIPYVVLELLSGTTLAAEIESRAAMRRHFSRDELVAIFTPVFEAVAFAHERGIMHRDLKPSNMMLVTEGGRMQPKVLDFGTARAEPTGAGRAATDGSRGKTGFTPLYAAPEQWDAAYGATGPRTDVYALGLTLAEAALLSYPMEIAAGGILSVFKASVDESSRPVLSNARPDLPPDLERVVLRAMRARPHERFSDARELLNAFRAALGPGSALASHSPSFSPPVAPSYGPPPHLFTSQPPPQTMSQRPQGAMLAGASTTNPYAMTSYGAQPSPPRSNVLPWVIGGAGLLVAIAMLGIGAAVFFGLPSPTGSAPAPVATAATAAPPVAAPGPGAPGAAAPAVAGAAAPAGATPRGAAPAAAPPGAAPGAAPTTPKAAPAPAAAGGPPPRIVLGGAIGMAPFWTQGDVMDVARAHQGDMAGCAREAGAAQGNLEGAVSITVSPDKNGNVGSVQCGMRVHGTPGETALCGCVQSAIGRWKFPPARAKLGALDAGPFIYDYKLFPP